jgi:hypothetical protein
MTPLCNSPVCRSRLRMEKEQVLADFYWVKSMFSFSYLSKWYWEKRPRESQGTERKSRQPVASWYFLYSPNEFRKIIWLDEQNDRKRFSHASQTVTIYNFAMVSVKSRVWFDGFKHHNVKYIETRFALSRFSRLQMSR